MSTACRSSLMLLIAVAGLALAAEAVLALPVGGSELATGGTVVTTPEDESLRDMPPRVMTTWALVAMGLVVVGVLLAILLVIRFRRRSEGQVRGPDKPG